MGVGQGAGRGQSEAGVRQRRWGKSKGCWWGSGAEALVGVGLHYCLEDTGIELCGLLLRTSVAKLSEYNMYTSGCAPGSKWATVQKRLPFTR